MKVGSQSLKVWVSLSFATLLVGVAAGLGGVILVRLLHYIQHHAYGYGLVQSLYPPDFLSGVIAAPPIRRVLALTLCGLIAGLGWFAIFRYGRPLVSIMNAAHNPKPQMPLFTTILHACLQVITIALGSPLGREVAPREVAATLAIWISRRLGLSPSQTQVMLACGAGAGLTAVYNVPLCGALFTLEVILCTFRWQAALPALFTSVIATLISWVGLGRYTQYQLANYSLTSSLILWALIIGPLTGVAGYYFQRLVLRARAKAPRDARVIVYCVINFVLIGLLSIYFPALLGNGKGPVKLGFHDVLTFETALILLILRVGIVLSSLRAGAWGGLLTPSLANGVLIACIVVALWNHYFSPLPQAACAAIGATAFLAAAQRMPITAVVLIFEFTGMNLNLLMPIIIAVAGAVGTRRYIESNLKN